MIWLFTIVGVCTCINGFFKIIDRIEQPKHKRRTHD